MSYTNFWPNRLKNPKALGFFVENQNCQFFGFLAKFGPKMPNNNQNMQNIPIWTRYLVINHKVAYNYQFWGNIKHFWLFHLFFCIFGI